MAFVKYSNMFKVGDIVRTTEVHDNFAGYFEVGSIVTITGVSPRGYDITDEDGNKVLECGFDGFEKVM